MTAGDLLRGTLRLLWYALRLQFDQPSAHKLAQVLKRRGVDEKVIDKALAEIDMKNLRGKADV